MFFKREKDSVVYYVSDKISLPHAFSTRYGGISELPHTKNMNFGYGKGDPDSTVDSNYRIFTSAVGLPESRAYATQIHSSRVVYANEGGNMGEADGFITDRKGITLTVKTADCLPILLADERAGIIGAVHAGWRGSVAHIQKKCVEAMTELGASAENIVAVIGPSIQKCHFEVSRDFEDLLAEFTDNASDYMIRSDGRLFCDLQKMNLDMLISAGVSRENIDVCALCTACDTESFFSHRVMGEKRGLMCAVISLGRPE